MSLDLAQKLGSMADTRTVIGCPEHVAPPGCTLVLTSCPAGELGDRTALSLPHAYAAWRQRIGGEVVSLEHHPSKNSPDSLLHADIAGIPEGTLIRLARMEHDLAVRVDEKHYHDRDFLDVATQLSALDDALTQHTHHEHWWRRSKP